MAHAITYYTLAKELHISPDVAQNLPVSLITDLLMVHGEIEKLKVDELNKHKGGIK